MYIRKLHITGVRNLQGLHLELGPGLNLFLGPNGAGKTAILEGLHLLARGRSFRSPKLKDVLNQDSSELLVRGEFEVGNPPNTDTLSAGLAKKLRGGTEMRVNGTKESRLSTLSRRIPLQLMLPNASDLVFGGPSLRRQFLNWGVFHVEQRYGGLWQQYTKVLRQRNALLKAAKPGLSYRGSELQSWTEKLAELGVAITVLRERYVLDWQPALVESLGSLGYAVDMQPNSSTAQGANLPVGADRGDREKESVGFPGLGSLGVRFESGIPPLDRPEYAPETATGSLPVESGLIAKYLNLLSENFAREVKYGMTQAGPHRADIDLTVGDSPANTSLSRGQGKSLALGMMVSQAQHLMRISGESSIFLIDDVGAELDSQNNQRFYNLLGSMGCQILATANELPSFAMSAHSTGQDATLANMRVFHVEHGSVSGPELPG